MKFLLTFAAIVATLDISVSAKPTTTYKESAATTYSNLIKADSTKLDFGSETDFFSNVVLSFKNVGVDNSTWFTIESGPNITTAHFKANNINEKSGLVVSQLPGDARTSKPFILTLAGWASEIWVPYSYSEQSAEYVSLDVRNETFLVKDVPYKWNAADNSSSYGYYEKNGAPYANCWTVDTKDIITQKNYDLTKDVKYVADGILRPDNENVRYIAW